MKNDDYLQDPEVHWAGLKTVLFILDKWQCNSIQKERLLNLKLVTIDLMSDVHLTEEQLFRVSYILNIHAELQTIFSNNDNIYGFMTMKNLNAPFNGLTPLDFAINQKMDGLKIVMEHLISLSMKW
ncbi:hypothetical protein J8L86_20100 [Shewanella sp. MMG014]|uniref:hypothetical protein n=1 Tax=Shewanella sp. MMG014 TaxID=2822691 RepID=UPI001B385A33|nr:hypothetical protein [Shewanella sp. MMG014]MBQ4892159.1 hypothetical protein [Shewanella sp. MMG014]